MIQNAGAFTREVVRVLQEAGRHEAVVLAVKVIYWTPVSSRSLWRAQAGEG